MLCLHAFIHAAGMLCSWSPVVLLLCASYRNIGICMYCRAAVQMCVYVQASSMSDMNKAERLCMVFTQFCDYNVSTLGSPSEMVSLAGCLCHLHGFVEYSKCVCAHAGQQAQKWAVTGGPDSPLS